MADLRENESLALVKELIQRGSDPVGILEDARSAMELVEKRFEKCEYFIPDLMMASEILKGISEIEAISSKSGCAWKEEEGHHRYCGWGHPLPGLDALATEAKEGTPGV